MSEIHRAVKRGDEAALARALGQGEKLDARDITGRTAAMVAAYEGH